MTKAQTSTQPLTVEEQRAWIALAKTQGVGPRAFQKLLMFFPSPSEVLKATGSALTETGVKKALVEAITKQQLSDADPEIAWLEQSDNHHILTLACSDYPRLLSELPDPPPVLYVNGDKTLLHDPQLAIVGTRNPTREGKENATSFARYLSEQGLCITSGLALGIDGYSHQGAIDANGPTIAVTATGQDRVYPGRHRVLAHRIVENGAIVTEFPLATHVHAGNFPRRNRIISGLSVGVLVIEAAEKSGSLITARLALEQGREVFAIPGSIHSPLAKGCHQLIRQGATLVETADHILDELSANLQLTSYRDTSDVTTKQADRVISELVDQADPEYEQLLAALADSPLPIDQMVVKTGLTPEAISSMLLMLELDGRVAACGNGLYKRLL